MTSTGKRPLAERLHEPGDARIRDERLRFLAQPVALHRRAVRREPAKVSRQLQQQGVDARATDPVAQRIAGSRTPTVPAIVRGARSSA